MKRLIFEAAKAGIKIHIIGGKIHIKTPWAMDRIPAQYIPILREIKQKQKELLACFALQKEVHDIPLLLNALLEYGIQLYMEDEKMSFCIKQGMKGIQKEAVELFKIADRHWNAIQKYVKESERPKNPG